MEDDPLYQSLAWTQLAAADAAIRRAAMSEVLAALRAQPLATPEVARDVLLLALGDTDDAVRCTAVRALGVLGPPELLVTAMQSPDARLRRTAVEVLQRRDVERSQAVRSAVLAAANDPDPLVARRALELAGGVRALDDAQLVALLDHPSQRVRVDAVRACAGRYLDVADADLIRALRRTVRHRATRRLALRVLGNVEPRAVSRGLLDDIVPGLDSRDWRERRDSAAALANLGSRARDALPAIEAAHRRVAADRFGLERCSLVYAAIRFGSGAPWIVDELIWYGQPAYRWVHWTQTELALDLLEWLGPLAAAAVPALTARAEAGFDHPAGLYETIAALVAIAPEAASTRALRDRFLTAAPDFAARIAARTAAFASHGAPAERASRVVAWLLRAPPYGGLDVANLALDTIEAAPSARAILEHLVQQAHVANAEILDELTRRLRRSTRRAAQVSSVDTS